MSSSGLASTRKTLAMINKSLEKQATWYALSAIGLSLEACGLWLQWQAGIFSWWALAVSSPYLICLAGIAKGKNWARITYVVLVVLISVPLYGQVAWSGAGMTSSLIRLQFLNMIYEPILCILLMLPASRSRFSADTIPTLRWALLGAWLVLISIPAGFASYMIGKHVKYVGDDKIVFRDGIRTAFKEKAEQALELRFPLPDWAIVAGLALGTQESGAAFLIDDTLKLRILIVRDIVPRPALYTLEALTPVQQIAVGFFERALLDPKSPSERLSLQSFDGKIPATQRLVKMEKKTMKVVEASQLKRSGPGEYYYTIVAWAPTERFELIKVEEFLAGFCRSGNLHHADWRKTARTN